MRRRIARNRRRRATMPVVGYNSNRLFRGNLKCYPTRPRGGETVPNVCSNLAFRAVGQRAQDTKVQSLFGSCSISRRELRQIEEERFVIMHETRIMGLPVARLLLATLTAIGLVFAGVSGAATDGNTTQRPSQDTSSALVQLNGEPLSTYVKTKPAHGKKIDFTNTTVKSYRAQLSALRNQFKQWLQANAPKAKITGSWDLSLNAVSVELNGTTLAKLQSAPQVKRAEYQGLYHPNSAPGPIPISPSSAPRPPGPPSAVGGAANAGKGVQGRHHRQWHRHHQPVLQRSRLPGHDAARRPRRYTNNKVIVAKVFNNKSPSRHYTAAPIQDHGTHVAGTVACNRTPRPRVTGATIPYPISGVAPAAQLGNYNIFPGDVTDARSEDILNALDAAYADGMDVANMSLGGGATASRISSRSRSTTSMLRTWSSRSPPATRATVTTPRIPRCRPAITRSAPPAPPRGP